MNRTKIILLGDAGVGKSCLLYCYQSNNCLRDNLPSQYYYTTIGVDFYSRTEYIEDEPVKFQIWDTSGQERFRSITDSYYRGCQVAIIVCSSISQKSLENIRHWANSFKTHNKEEAEMYVVLNHYQTRTKYDKENRVYLRQVQDVAYEIDPNIKVSEISCWDGRGIDSLFQDIREGCLEKIRETKQKQQQNYQEEIIKLQKPSRRCSFCSLI
jgi:Ras-related protein Rab-1A